MDPRWFFGNFLNGQGQEQVPEPEGLSDQPSQGGSQGQEEEVEGERVFGNMRSISPVRTYSPVQSPFDSVVNDNYSARSSFSGAQDYNSSIMTDAPSWYEEQTGWVDTGSEDEGTEVRAYNSSIMTNHASFVEEEAEVASPPKRKRGRPRKQRTPVSYASTSPATSDEEASDAYTTEEDTSGPSSAEEPSGRSLRRLRRNMAQQERVETSRGPLSDRSLRRRRRNQAKVEAAEVEDQSRRRRRRRNKAEAEESEEEDYSRKRRRRQESAKRVQRRSTQNRKSTKASKAQPKKRAAARKPAAKKATTNTRAASKQPSRRTTRASRR
ncbi:hypothetical protein HDE_08613 [Halotydeus destructor]|nr:hypothetical protein HDE_08613 [Halotydeus destructor]